MVEFIYFGLYEGNIRSFYVVLSLVPGYGSRVARFQLLIDVNRLNIDKFMAVELALVNVCSLGNSGRFIYFHNDDS